MGGDHEIAGQNDRGSVNTIPGSINHPLALNPAMGKGGLLALFGSRAFLQGNQFDPRGFGQGANSAWGKDQPHKMLVSGSGAPCQLSPFISAWLSAKLT